MVLQIGFQHGEAAKERVTRSIAFYTKMFVQTSKKTWPEVRETACVFDEAIKTKWPAYHAEMQGKHLSQQSNAPESPSEQPSGTLNTKYCAMCLSST